MTWKRWSQQGLQLVWYLACTLRIPANLGSNPSRVILFFAIIFVLVRRLQELRTDLYWKFHLSCQPIRRSDLNLKCLILARRCGCRWIATLNDLGEILVKGDGWCKNNDEIRNVLSWVELSWAELRLFSKYANQPMTSSCSWGFEPGAEPGNILGHIMVAGTYMLQDAYSLLLLQNDLWYMSWRCFNNRRVVLVSCVYPPYGTRFDDSSSFCTHSNFKACTCHTVCQ